MIECSASLFLLEVVFIHDTTNTVRRNVNPTALFTASHPTNNLYYLSGREKLGSGMESIGYGSLPNVPAVRLMRR
jgi:hypothetical protein